MGVCKSIFFKLRFLYKFMLRNNAYCHLLILTGMSDSLQFPLNFFNNEDMVLQVTTYFVNPSAIGGGARLFSIPPPCVFFSN